MLSVACHPEVSLAAECHAGVTRAGLDQVAQALFIATTAKEPSERRSGEYRIVGKTDDSIKKLAAVQIDIEHCRYAVIASSSECGHCSFKPRQVAQDSIGRL